MERPPLTTVLSSVLTAAVENTNRPALLGVMADVIPLPRRSPESLAESLAEETDDPDPAA
jgi:hypothetical protein